jgi:hypothetical protein
VSLKKFKSQGKAVEVTVNSKESLGGGGGRFGGNSNSTPPCFNVESHKLDIYRTPNVT